MRPPYQTEALTHQWKKRTKLFDFSCNSVIIIIIIIIIIIVSITIIILVTMEVIISTKIT